MTKKILIFGAITVLLLLLLPGCSSISGSNRSVVGHKIVRKAEINSEWQMYQLNINLPAGSNLPILLKLADGAKVDGYFYLEKGDNLDFQIEGNSTLHKAAGQANNSGKVSSSRFSFIASKAEGKSYILTLSNTAKQDKVTAFLEVVYPKSGSIFVPLEAK